MRNKVNHLELLCSVHDLDVLCISEHMLVKEEIKFYEYLADLQLASFFCRESFACGGVAVYLKPGIDFKPLNLSEFCEELHGEFTGIILTDLSLIIIAMYRSPNGNMDRFFYLLEVCLTFLISFNVSIIIGTDHNIDLLRSSADRATFQNILRSFNIFCSVHGPTRGLASLDNFLTNLDVWSYDAEISRDMLADHRHVFLTIYDNALEHKTNMCPPVVKNLSYRVINPTSVLSFTKSLQQKAIVWYDVIKNLGTNVAFQYFFDCFKTEYDLHFPVKCKSVVACRTKTKFGRPSDSRAKNDKHEWFTPELSQARNNIIFLHDLCKVRPDLEPRLRMLRREYRFKLKEAKQVFTANRIMRSGNPCKAAWDLINSRKPKQGSSTNRDFATAEEFNDYFIESVESILANLPCNVVDPLSKVPHVGPPFKFEWSLVSEREVVASVNSFKSSESKDIYGMSCNLLKSIIHILAPILTYLINLCLVEGFFPDELKWSRTVPVYKKGPTNMVSSYRPISVIPVLAKVFESLLFKQLYDHFEQHLLLAPAQFGFRRGRSTVMAVEHLLAEVMRAFENKNSTAAVLVDLSRAFDCVSHDVLVRKLEMYGLGEVALKMVKSYLVDRRQMVNWNGHESSPRPVMSGVPQGSVLGPLLFIVIINDLYHSVSGRAVLFADDTTLFSSHSNVLGAELAVRDLLSVASEWFLANRLVLNKSKTQLLTFSLTHDVSVSDPVKLLGFTLDPTLTWNSHVEALVVRLSRVLFLLRRLSCELKSEHIRMAYYAFFHSLLSYGTRLWGHSAHTHKVLLMQKKAVRILSNAGYLDHCRPLFVRNGILTVYSVYIFQCLLAIRDNFDSYVTNNDVHTHNTRASPDVFIPRCRLSKTLKCFPVSGFKFFNFLPVEIRSLPRPKFATMVKSWLVANPLYHTDEYFGLDTYKLL